MTTDVVEVDVMASTFLRPSSRQVSRCPVDAGGVPAEWIEAAVATDGQPTLVYFPGPGDAAAAAAALLAARLAISTGARVLVVGCRPTSRSRRAVAEDGAAAWRWLLGEGCDLSTTAFVTSLGDDARAVDVYLDAQTRISDHPTAGVWWVTPADQLPMSPPDASLSQRLIGAGAVRLEPSRTSTAIERRRFTPDRTPSHPCRLRSIGGT